MCDGPDFFLCLLAILFPPIGVWIKRGICSVDSFINIALCCLGYLPGLIHSWYIISAYPDPGYEPIPDSESRGHVIYYYGTVNGPSAPHAQFHGQQAGTANAFAQSPQPHAVGKKGKEVGTTAVPPARADQSVGEGSSAAPDMPPPPSYSDAVKADNKIQDRD